jgi:hypothetical protein
MLQKNFSSEPLTVRVDMIPSCLAVEWEAAVAGKGEDRHMIFS